MSPRLLPRKDSNDSPAPVRLVTVPVTSKVNLAATAGLNLLARSSIVAEHRVRDSCFTRVKLFTGLPYLLRIFTRSIHAGTKQLLDLVFSAKFFLSMITVKENQYCFYEERVFF